HMVSVSMVETGDCLRDLGRLNEAATTYEDAVRRAEKLGDKRQVAVIKFQFGTVRLRQQRYTDALANYTEARDVATILGEPGLVATAWYQIGMVHKSTM